MNVCRLFSVSADFPETEWSQLLRLRDPAHPGRPAILDRLAQQYWQPAYHYLRALRRLTAHDAEDLTQQFFAMLLSRGDLDRLSPDRGSFRGFLKTALRNFVISAERAAKTRPQTWAFGEAEAAFARYQGLGPDEVFDRAWGHAVLAEAVTRLEQDLQPRQFEVFAAYCLADEPATYEQLAARFQVSHDDVRNRLREARQRLRAIVRRLLREYLGSGEDLERELAAILDS